MLIRQEPGISFKKSAIFFPATSCNAGSPAPGFGRSKETQKFLKDQAPLARISIMRSGFGNATHQRSTSRSVKHFSSKAPAFDPLPETPLIPSRTESCARMLTSAVGCKATWRRQGDRRKEGAAAAGGRSGFFSKHGAQHLDCTCLYGPFTASRRTFVGPVALVAVRICDLKLAEW